MIHASTQLKALVRNKSHGDNAKAMTLIRNFVMERFLERMSLSKYSGNLILKGGLLIASMVGLDDGTQFAVKSVESIMDEAEYPGIRFKLEAALDTMKII